MLAFMVSKGFSLLEIRKLYFDELIDFYKQTIYASEQSGEFKEGTYDRMVGNNDAPSVVNQLRKGIAKATKK